MNELLHIFPECIAINDLLYDQNNVQYVPIHKSFVVLRHGQIFKSGNFFSN